MSDGPARGVSIGDGGSFVRLVRDSGRPVDHGMTPAVIDVRGGPFAGTVRDDTLVGVSAFCDQLDELYERLTGTATLASYEKFTMTFEGNGLGAIAVSVELHGEHLPSSKLCFEFEIDQTFLPAIIRALKAEFPDG